MLVVDDQVSSPKTVTSEQLAEVLRPCADKISIEILKAIETADALKIRCTGPYLREELEIGSKKQFYTRIQRLKLQGIIKHGGQGTYVLTTFGKIITGNVFRVINTCIENLKELEVIDGIDINRFSTAEYIALAHKLLKDSELQRLVLQQFTDEPLKAHPKESQQQR